MSYVPVVLDTCVLYPDLVRDILLTAAERGGFSPIWSPDILVELERNLLERLTPQQVASVLASMRRAFPESEQDGYQRLVPDMTNHPKDRHVLALAVDQRADVIVTDNSRDFPAKALDMFGVVAMTADEFLLDQLDQAPARMRDVLAAVQRRRKNPPITMADLLDRVGKPCPAFVEELRTLVPYRALPKRSG